MRRNRTIAIFFMMVIMTGCKEIYKPAIISAPVSYLVIEGVLNTSGPTSIRLTRSFKLDDTAQLRGERNAQVTVEGKDNISRALTMTADGLYTSPGLNLDYGEEYRLRIRTGGKEYLSDYVVARRTPEIDSIGFREEEEGVQVYVNTHDATNATRYYRWEYDETWEIRSYYFSHYKYENDVVVERGPADDVSVCWKYDYSTRILTNSTTSLASDIVYRAPLTFMPTGDEKLAVRYSILVRQYAIDKPGFEFFELMKKNTESLGTIFDPQPSEITGNFTCITDPSEPVIGYLSASSIEEKRFFINVSQLNNWRFYEDCPAMTVPNHPDSIAQAYQGGMSIYTAFFPPVGIQPVFYYISYKHCVECPARGGSLQKPAYW